MAIPVKEWDKTIGGRGSDFPAVVRQTIDGGYIIAGWSNSGISGDKTEASRGGIDGWIVKITHPVQHTMIYSAGANGSISGTTPQTLNQGASGSKVTALP